MVKLIKANLRKDRTILIVFVLIIIFSTFLMHTGLLASNYKQLYDDYAEQTNLCDFILFTNESTQLVHIHHQQRLKAEQGDLLGVP